VYDDHAFDARPLVTGAAHGLGREVARQLAERGHAVLVSARDPAAAAQTAEELGASVTALPALDLTDPDAVGRVVDAIGADPGRLDVLVNNAAAFVDWSETGSGADLDAARVVLETNLFGTWRLTQALLPLLRRSPEPRVVNVSSGAGSHGDPAFGLTARGGAAASYGISKAALNALTATLATELADTGVLVNSVCPGLTATYPGAEAMGARPVEESATGVVWAATLPADGPNGGFFRDTEPCPGSRSSAQDGRQRSRDPDLAGLPADEAGQAGDRGDDPQGTGGAGVAIAQPAGAVLLDADLEGLLAVDRRPADLLDPPCRLVDTSLVHRRRQQWLEQLVGRLGGVGEGVVDPVAADGGAHVGGVADEQQPRLGPPVDGRDPDRQQRQLVDRGERVEPVAQPGRGPPDRRDDRRDALVTDLGQRPCGDVVADLPGVVLTEKDERAAGLGEQVQPGQRCVVRAARHGEPQHVQVRAELGGHHS
jgi:NAD(P)-dependent dehydrogenase (short-subunit alcohol dehydrogenase family)